MKPTRTMARLVLALALGLWLLAVCDAEITVNIGCRYRGVYHIERNGRYKMLREEAVQLCNALNTTLANMTQMENAKAAGLETCRYGWIKDYIVIPRIQPNPICAANNIGVYILVSNITDKYDAFCYNASETREKVCDKVLLPENYRLFLPTDIDPSRTQDPQRPGRRDPAQGQTDEHGSDHYPSHDDSHHSEGSSDHGPDEDATDPPETEDSLSPYVHPAFSDDTTDAPAEFPVDKPGEDSTDATYADGFRPGIIPINGEDDSTKAPQAGDSHHGQDGSQGQRGEDETTDATNDVHNAGGFPKADQDPTEEPHLGDSDQGHGVGESPGTGVEGTMDDPDSDHSDHGYPPGGSSVQEGDDAATGSPHPDDSHHGHHPSGSDDHGPYDTNDDSLPDDSRDSVSDTATDKPGQPGHKPSHDFAKGPYHSGSDSVTGTAQPGDSHHGPGLDGITDSANAFWPPHIKIPGATALTDLDLSNSVDPSAVTKKSSSGRSKTKPKASQPGGQDDSDSGSHISHTDPTPGDDDAYPVGGSDSDSLPGGPRPDDGDDSDVTTDEGLLDSSHDVVNEEEGTENPEAVIPKLNEAHPGGEDEATTGGDWVKGHGSDGSSDDDGYGGEGDRSASGGSITTTIPRAKRQQRIPDWLIVVVALVSLSLILAVCIAVNSRQVCGHKKKLVINGNGSALEEGQSGEMNGDPSKSQEMVNLMNKDQHRNAGDPQEQPLNSDSGRSQQNKDMKIGV